MLCVYHSVNYNIPMKKASSLNVAFACACAFRVKAAGETR